MLFENLKIKAIMKVIGWYDKQKPDPAVPPPNIYFYKLPSCLLSQQPPINLHTLILVKNKGYFKTRSEMENVSWTVIEMIG